MKFNRFLFGFCLGTSLLGSSLTAQQQPASAPIATTVPRLVNFSGKALDVQGKAISGISGVTFAIYKEQYEGAPLWLETQNIQADTKGNYTSQLGATKPEGLPLDLFTSGEARWLGVTVNGGQEQPRVLLLSVPYALKAADAETLGGLPASAFVLARMGQASAANTTTAAASTVSANNSAPPVNPAVTGKGVVSYIPLWDTTSDIVDSVMFQKSSQIGINTATPASTLDVNGATIVRGNLTLPATGTATATSGKNSQPTTLTASVFNKTTGTAVAQNFRWQAEATGNDTSTASGSLNLLYGSGSNTISETGLHIASNGQLTFASGQTFPGTGTVTSVGLSAPSSDFTVSGSPVTKTGTLAFNWNVAPTNANTANSIVKRDSTGSFNAGAIYGTLGVLGETAVSCASCAGVSGVNTGGGIGVYASGGTGVYGVTSNTAAGGAGVFGQSGAESSTGSHLAGANVGVWGDGGVDGFPAVLGTNDNSIAGYFENNGVLETLFAYNLNGPLALFANGTTGASCYIDASANLSCSGVKNAVVPMDGGKRIVALSAIESPKVWFEDAGSAQLANGAAVVALDPEFMQTVNTEVEYHVFLTPYGDCKGLYVTERTANSFAVHELGGGAASLSFGYRIMALRKNYENVRFADHTKDLDAQKAMLARLHTSAALRLPSHDPAK
jgi:hypothetical protein